MESPIYHLHQEDNSRLPLLPDGISFAMLQNLTNVCNSEDKEMIWEFIASYAPDEGASRMPYLDRLIEYAIIYYRDFIKPNKKYLVPTGKDAEALQKLHDHLSRMAQESIRDAEQVQTIIYAIGKECNYEPLRDWFGVLYETLLGQKQGPRMGSFFLFYGIDNSCQLIAKALKGELR